ncbi:mannose-1-phosphate guanylyltransferase [Metabacillus elymi]|uniref:Mannose-1-phosphate guanylyltransferase n=1 Tax=Metabacillus elymi TaxID=2745198 RepID=A0ABX6S9J0_9BACI|nr:sugar phosphate nucleotidyltransferase [Metabacillus sp. KUDC1714]QNF28466.1 mannose-1-phosphate guanylyltransferase [Metabacillus sp. KUDC1714]
MKVVIMAGGQGTRFWPWSVKDKPKQFLSLMSNETMLQQTYNRFRKWLPSEKIYILTTEEYFSLVKEQIPSINNNQIIMEPLPRDTAPCLALTALHFLKDNDNEAFAAVPADHYIPDDHVFPEIFSLAEEIAENKCAIVTLGIKPTRPETGYGYIQAERNEVSNNEVSKNEVLRVKAFIEKPSMKKAVELLKTDNIYWNSGIFIWKPSTIGYYMEKFRPDIWEKLKNCEQVSKTQYSLVPKISIDFAILEKADTIYTIPVNLQWYDVGNWSAWDRLNNKKNGENLVQGDDIHLLTTKNCVIKSEDKKAIVIGVEDLIIASTEDGLLVCHKSLEHKIKDILNDKQ